MTSFQHPLDAYRAVRQAEGWGAPDPSYYRNLPYVGPDDPQREIWHVRAATFHALLPMLGENRRVLDVGAGNGWLAYRLAQRGHTVTAVDISDDERDGLGAHKHYPARFQPYQADFSALPFPNARFDVVVFNASLHYAREIAPVVSEALRVLDRTGQLIVMDSPVYRDAASGRAMFAEKKRGIKDRLNVEISSVAAGFLTFEDFDRLARQFKLKWEWVEPFVDLRWGTRHWRARLRGRREPAHFGLMVGKYP